MLGNHLNIVTELSKFDKFNESISETSDNSSFSLVINYPCSSTTFCDPIEAYAKPGVYLFEVWGAQGGKGGTQEQGGASSLKRGSTAGTKGKGGNGSNTNGEFWSDGSGGGGGGYYGGGGGSSQVDHPSGSSAGGGGGSGYISDIYIHFQKTTANENGDQQFLSPNGVTETGHSGSGAIKIVYYPDLLFIMTCEKSNKFNIIILIYIFLISK